MAGAHIGLEGAGLTFLLLLSGCGYPTVERPAYEFAKALHTVFNHEDPEQLKRAREYIDRAQQDNEISARDHALFVEMITQAEAGDWDGAAREVRALLAAQNDH